MLATEVWAFELWESLSTAHVALDAVDVKTGHLQDRFVESESRVAGNVLFNIFHVFRWTNLPFFVHPFQL